MKFKLINSQLELIFRSKLQRDRERDISEQIALGLPAKTITGGEVQFDQRLMNSSKGMDSGYGDDEAYNVYDKPWRDSSSLGQHLYRPSKNVDKDIYGDDLEKIVKTSRSVRNLSKLYRQIHSKLLKSLNVFFFFFTTTPSMKYVFW